MNELNYEKMLEFVLRFEGGYANHPSDRGGETMYGITHSTYDAYRLSKKLPSQSVRKISKVEVQEIYRSKYWYPAGCHLLTPKLAFAHFDWSINHGVIGAIKTLQRVVSVTEDGVIGDITRHAIATKIQAVGDAVLARRYCSIRMQKYEAFIRNDSSQAVFKNGWMNRVNALLAAIA